MQSEVTLTGVMFKYSGSLQAGLVIHKKADVSIPLKAIKLIMDKIRTESPVLMGASRDNPPEDSIGKSLMDNGFSPQFSSYVIPLLMAENFCTANDTKPFVITVKPATAT